MAISITDEHSIQYDRAECASFNIAVTLLPIDMQRKRLDDELFVYVCDETYWEN